MIDSCGSAFVVFEVACAMFFLLLMKVISFCMSR